VAGATSRRWRHIPALLLDEPVDRRELPRLFPIRPVRRLVDHAVHLHRRSGFTAFKVKCTGTRPVWDVAVLQCITRRPPAMT